MMKDSVFKFYKIGGNICNSLRGKVMNCFKFVFDFIGGYWGIFWRFIR